MDDEPAVSQQTADLKPYQDGDFVELSFGKEAFKGPIFHVRYPPICDPMKEMMDWHKLGYRMSMAFDYGDGPTIVVLGEIPEWFQDGLKHAGASITLAKPRGPLQEI
ncbi:MAG: hypothetical protein ABIG30_01880 [Candidatus Aenigmatarchaeota archaeon]